jgi:two-component system, NtrC family, sensor kinase
MAAEPVIAESQAVDELKRQLAATLERQTAMSEILRAISQSPTDVQPVLSAIAASARRFCGADNAGVILRQESEMRVAAHDGPLPAALGLRVPLDRSTGMGRAISDGCTVHIPDVQALDPAEFSRGQELARTLGFRAVLAVPMLQDGRVIGALLLRRSEPGEFTPQQIELLETFATQAVIAIENVRLLSELRERTDDLAESLEYQTATSELLEVISRSGADIQPVFDTMLASAARLCGVEKGDVAVLQGEVFRHVAFMGCEPDELAWLKARVTVPGRVTSTARALLDRRVDHVLDQSRDPERVAPKEATRKRTTLSVPLLRDGEPLGVISLLRDHVEPFSERQIALIETFAGQAVIAMENVRLLSELTRREEELRVTFDHMGDGVVMFDADLRLAAWNRNFQELLDVPDEFLASRPGLEDYVRLLVQRGELGDRDPDKEVARYRDRATRQWSAERTRPDGRVLEVRNNPVPGGGAVLIYSDITERRRAETEISTARDAAEAALERQTATADILKVIASSPTDVEPVLAAVVKAAVRFCGATDAMIQLRDGDSVMSRAHEGPLTYNANDRRSLDRSTGGGRAIVDAQTCHLPDIEALDPAEFVTARRLAALHGFRAIVAAPLKREDTAIGAVVLRKVEAGPFTLQQIALLETFAAQAVIAIENVRLFTELRDSLERLRAAQANLIQAEKMASLGQLTAGIAHEIKNPLNFVNNFAGLSVELLGELKEIAEPILAGMSEGARADFGETIELITGNLNKIAEHGKRADGIVKSMLSHSRGGTGDWQESNINALVEEALNLAFHGARAQDKEFNVTLELDLAPGTQPIELVPQDVTRVFLNLFGNGFYAANKRRLAGADTGYRPTLKVSTRDLGEAVEVKVRDNGIGIPPEVRAKLFQPFFTTKPTGEGTGLGLSISYDIVTQQHGGTIDVESEPGSFTEFTVRLPRGQRAARSRGT